VDAITTYRDIVPSVFISYSHDNDGHLSKALGLSNRLRKEGIDASIDAYALHRQKAGRSGWKANSDWISSS
jgi:hypothetical protein